MAKINILALGGLDEKQRRLYILEIDSKIFILDSGVYEPLNNDFGIQHFIPNMEYLSLNKDKIKAVFLSSSNRMNIGSLLEIVNIKPDVEIYGSKTTLDSLNIFFKGFAEEWKKIIYEKGETKKISGIEIKAINMASVLPGTYGYQFKTTEGNILYFTDYILDSIKEYEVSSISGFLPLINDKNLLLISGVSMAKENEALSSKFKIKDLVKKYFNKKQRLVVVVYENEIINVVELIELSRKNKRKLFIKSRTMFSLITMMIANGDIKEFPVKKYSEYREEDSAKSIVILSGTRTKLYKTIDTLIEAHNKNDFAFEKNDIVYFAALPQPGNEHIFAGVTNKISRIDPIVIKPSVNEKKIFGTTAFDIRNMIDLLKPNYFMPVSAFYTQLSIAKNIAEQNGMDSKKIIIGENGEVFTINKGIYEGINYRVKEIESKVIESVGDVSINSKLIDERKSLGKDGIAIISFIYNIKKLVIASDIDIQMKGVVLSKGQEDVLDKIKELIIRTTDELSETKQNVKKGIPLIRKLITKIFRENFKKVPNILFNIMEN
ncbi:MAG: ribonuclease J [Mycoplasmataceae bacterium]|nr:ribonuclease J [Mycoplasmataceae bacterium]